MKMILIDEGDYDETVMLASSLRERFDVRVVQPNVAIIIRDVMNQATFEDELLVEVLDIR